jgi:hypothetical protein
LVSDEALATGERAIEVTSASSEVTRAIDELRDTLVRVVWAATLDAA